MYAIWNETVVKITVFCGVTPCGLVPTFQSILLPRVLFPDYGVNRLF